jgi:asparagine synthase (glutamine-hydrolysing)
MGIKPLYYQHTDRRFLFASEVRSLLSSGLVPRKPDPVGLLSYLTFGSVYEPWTIVEGIKAVPPGHLMTINGDVVTDREYWNPLRASSIDSPQPDHLPTILRDAVLSHLVSDVPVGIFLSGGIDSSALVAILSQNGVRANTFSLVFNEQDFDEGQYSREIARRFATEHHEIPISSRDALDTLPEALCAMDQPTIDGINTYLVSAKTRAAGVKVALTGLGADEMFAGYSNFRRVPKLEAFSKRFGRLPKVTQRPLSASLSLFAGKNDRSSKFFELVQDASKVHPYFLLRTLFGRAERERLFLAPDLAIYQHSLDQVLQQSILESLPLDAVNRISYLESSCYMRNTLLRDSDFMSMAHGLELRVPFLDRPLVEACFRIPGKKKLQGTQSKSLLLASLGVALPPEIVNRPKRGFTLPFEQWLRNEMRPALENTLLKSNWDQTSISATAVREVWDRFLANKTSWSRPWSLFVLQRWCQQNLA